MNACNFLEKVDNKWKDIPNDRILSLTIRELCCGDKLIMLNVDGKRIFYVGNGENFLKLQELGKEVCFAQDLFAQWKENLVKAGLLPETKIFTMTLDEANKLNTVFKIFPGAKEIKNARN